MRVDASAIVGQHNHCHALPKAPELHSIINTFEDRAVDPENWINYPILECQIAEETRPYQQNPK